MHGVTCDGWKQLSARTVMSQRLSRKHGIALRHQIQWRSACATMHGRPQCMAGATVGG
jgi:hypothetical protein